MVDSNGKRIIICSDCGREKEYHAKGLCKQCYQRMNLARWRRNNPERKRQSASIIVCEVCGERKPCCAKGLCGSCYQHIWHLEHRSENNRKASERYYKNRERRREQMDQWMKSNPEKMKIYRRRYYEKTKEQQAKQHLIWCRSNPEKIAAKNNRRRASVLNLPSTLTGEEAEQMLKGFSCFYCGSDNNKLTLDHFIPISRGGGTTKANTVIACQNCNSSKKDKMPGEILQQLYLFEVEKYG